jgi:Family of unknown function (DUF5681)
MSTGYGEQIINPSSVCTENLNPHIPDEVFGTHRGPKGRKSVGKILRDALHRTIEVREGERIRAMPKIEAVIEVNLNKALKGDHRSFAKLMDVADKLGIIELLPDEQKISITKTTSSLPEKNLLDFLKLRWRGLKLRKLIMHLQAAIPRPKSPEAGLSDVD